jgi:ribosome-binding protein aMBF1 (putative translation factor)
MSKAKKSVKKPSRKTSDAVEVLRRRYLANDSDMASMVQEELANLDIARKIHELRVRAGLSQRDLAKLVGTTASVICRLEDADYDGHSLPMLVRIGSVLRKRLDIRFVSLRTSSSEARA